MKKKLVNSSPTGETKSVEKDGPANSLSESSVNELERLRDILFGSQARTIETRLNDLEVEIDEKFESLSLSSSAKYKKLAADFQSQLHSVQKELEELEERTRILQSESRERDDNLREEFLNLITSLESKKASRQELGQMLEELGIRLKNDSEPS
ncbi:MAG: hypothetical protein JW963_01615 [Anaerolineales bacterium]|nr:hypothetical protein [Anaerolineales bacterium]